MKRNLFAELVEGFDALKAEREGKITLRRHTVESKPAPKVTAKDLIQIGRASCRERVCLAV